MTVFEFGNFRDFLKVKLGEQLHGPAGRKRSNLARISKSLGYRSPSLLSMIVNGKRLPSESLVDSLVNAWKMNASEREYFRLLVQLERLGSRGKDTSEVVQRLRKIGSGRATHTFTSQEFSSIREWYYLVIYQLAGSPGFNEDPIWISRKLRRKVTPSQVEKALVDLVQLGMLARDPSGKLSMALGANETTHDVPSSAIRMHHKGMMERAGEAIEEQSVEQRHFNALTLRIDPRRVPELKQRLLAFVREISSDFDDPGSNNVYQLNLQFFEHTKEDPAGGISNETH